MAEPVDFSAAIRALAADLRERAGEHPEPEEIAAYADGKLAPERAEAVGDHFAVCPECAALVLDYTKLAPTPAEGASQRAEVAAAYDAVRRDLGLQPQRDRSTAGRGASADSVMPWLLAAATLAAVVLGVWGWSQHRALIAASSPRINVAAVDLDPEGSDQERGEEPVRQVDLSSGATLFLSLPGIDDPGALRVAIVDSAGRERWAVEGARRHRVLGNLSLYLPPGSLAPGSYEIRLLTAGGGAALATYPLEVGRPASPPPA
jgi:anti-sigma factor RsiW